MELIYMYIDSFRNFNNVGISLSDKFIVTYDSKNQNINIIKKENYISIYPPHIQNICALVGKNSVGKTNLIDLIGMKKDDRNKNNAEFKKTYEKDPETGLRNKFVKEEKYANYFLIYYFGFFDGEDLYCLEGNFIKENKELFSNEVHGENYFESHHWFSIVCSYNENKFKYYCDTKEWTKFYSNTDWATNDIIPCIISFRDNYNKYIFDYNSSKPIDDYSISIPRRIAKIKPRLKISIMNFLIKMMNTTSSKSSMYRNSEYIFYILYSESYQTEEKPFTEIYKKFSDIEYYKGKLVESFLSHTFYQLNETYKDLEEANHLFSTIKISDNATYTDSKDYYEKIFLTIIHAPNRNLTDKDLTYAVRRFRELLVALDNPSIEIKKEGIKIIITADSDATTFEDVLHLLDDDYQYSVVEDFFGLFTSFFECRIDYLSDGEAYYLNLLSSIDEQMNNEIFCKSKNHFIILFDEPETNMHPELARSFICDLIDILSNYPEKAFQIIIATHSPFILSDLLQGNIQMLTKQDDGNCKVESCNISTFSANIHEILSNSFFMSCTIGAYSKKILDNTIRALKNNADPKEYGLDKNTIAYIISIIGEPIIKQKLTEMYNKKYGQKDQRSEIAALIEKINNPLYDTNNLRTEINNLLNRIESSDKNESD